MAHVFMNNTHGSLHSTRMTCCAHELQHSIVVEQVFVMCRYAVPFGVGTLGVCICLVVLRSTASRFVAMAPLEWPMDWKVRQADSALFASQRFLLLFELYLALCLLLSSCCFIGHLLSTTLALILWGLSTAAKHPIALCMIPHSRCCFQALQVVCSGMLAMCE